MKSAPLVVSVLTAGSVLAGVAAVVSTGVNPPQNTLASYHTTLVGRDGNQRHNALLAAKHFDGVVILPGRVLSFNETAGSWSRDKGYRRAPVSYDGRLIDAWGGGVCQTSTTLYNAALVAGLEIVERHAHHYAPTYIAPGRDSAVAFPNIDLKLRNPYPFPVTVRTSVTDTITVKIVGRGPIPEVIVEDRIEQTTKPKEFVFGSGSNPRLVNPGKSGFRVSVFRRIGDVKELVSEDTYPVMHRVVTRGD
ncbi:MAG: VanW family protein [Fimbriimonadaceae bacterium]|jgi:vancomycin resistance protein YoaR|nr:VanW family protein [Fimbriimonadaceae bacterium]